MEEDQETQIREYQGAMLFQDQFKAMGKIESLIGEPIPNIDNLPEKVLQNQISYEQVFGNIRFKSENYNVIELDLTNINLTNIPSEIKELTSLQALNLDNNKISSIPRFIKSLGKLKELILTKNLIHELLIHELP